MDQIVLNQSLYFFESWFGIAGLRANLFLKRILDVLSSIGLALKTILADCQEPIGVCQFLVSFYWWSFLFCRGIRNRTGTTPTPACHRLGRGGENRTLATSTPWTRTTTILHPGSRPWRAGHGRVLPLYYTPCFYNSTLSQHFIFFNLVPRILRE